MEYVTYDEASGRCFESSRRVIEEACKTVNSKIRAKEIISWTDAVREVYRELGLEEPEKLSWPPQGNVIVEWDEVVPEDLGEENEIHYVGIKKGTNEALKTIMVERMLFEHKLEELNEAYAKLNKAFEDYMAKGS